MTAKTKKRVYLIDNRELPFPYSRKEAEALDDADFARIAEDMGNAWDLEDFVIAYSQGSLPPYDCQNTRIIELTLMD